MDAVEFLKERTRMCNYYMSCCRNCPGNKVEYCATLCAGAIDMVPIVEQWAKSHPVKTQQSEFLAQWPNARLDTTGCLMICPMDVMGREYISKNIPGCINGASAIRCDKCRRDFWLTEIKDGET